MLGNLLLFLTSIAYLGLVAINLNRFQGTGEYNVGWGFVVLTVLAAYVISSLLLTVSMAYNGRFEWLSETRSTRQLFIGAGWLCLTAGVVYITMINQDWRAPGTANTSGLLVIRYGAIWIPLLMLIPYFMLLRQDAPVTIPHNYIKIPLLVGCSIGMTFLLLSRQQLKFLFQDEKAVEARVIEDDLRQVEWNDSNNNIPKLLYFTRKEADEQVRQAALTRLKARLDLEDKLVEILDGCSTGYDYIRVYCYLEENTVAHPERFVEPMKKAIIVVGDELKYRPQSFGSESDFLDYLNIEGLCRALDGQLKPYRAEFRPAMLKMQEELAREPKPQYKEICSRYKTLVDNWLASQ